MLFRLALAAALLTAVASCSHGPSGSAAEAAAPSKPAFVAYPPSMIAGVKDPHDYMGKALCQRCHTTDLKLTNAAGPNELCKECHKFHHSNHPVDVVQKTKVTELPLAGGKVACHTCHDPHQKKSLLRKPFNELCLVCHKGH